MINPVQHIPLYFLKKLIYNYNNKNELRIIIFLIINITDVSFSILRTYKYQIILYGSTAFSNLQTKILIKNRNGYYQILDIILTFLK